MSAVDILLILAVLAAAALAVRSIVKRRKSGGCSCGCSDCTASCGERKKQN